MNKGKAGTADDDWGASVGQSKQATSTVAGASGIVPRKSKIETGELGSMQVPKALSAHIDTIDNGKVSSQKLDSKSSSNNSQGNLQNI